MIDRIQKVNWERVAKIAVGIYGAHWVIIGVGCLLSLVAMLVWRDADIDFLGFVTSACIYAAYTIVAALVLIIILGGIACIYALVDWVRS